MKSKINIIELIEKKLESLTGLNQKTSTEIAKEIIEENDSDEMPSLQSIASMVFKIKNDQKSPDEPDEKIPVKVDGETKYDVIDNKYVWSSKRAGDISLSVDEANEIFYEYSQFGLDMSQEQVRNTHHFSIPQWNSIKCVLWLYKKSNIFSPYTVDHTENTELHQLISDKLKMKEHDMHRLIEEEYKNHTIKAYKKVIKKDKEKRFYESQFFQELAALLPETEEIKIRKPYSTRGNANGPEDLLISIADLHIGAKTEGLIKTRNYNSEETITRLNAIATRVNSLHAKSANICILGDLIESFSGMNHSNTFEGINMHGGKVVVEAYKILSNFFESVDNLKGVKIIGGNHDRASASNKDDVHCTIAGIISFMLQEKYKGIFSIEYSDLILSQDLDSNLRIIMAHGDKKVLKAAGASLDAKVIEFGSQERFNVILTGHLHSRGINEDKCHFRWYKTPSIFSGNYYSESNGWNANPGYYIIYQDSDTKLPVVMDCPL